MASTMDDNNDKKPALSEDEARRLAEMKSLRERMSKPVTQNVISKARQTDNTQGMNFYGKMTYYKKGELASADKDSKDNKDKDGDNKPTKKESKDQKPKIAKATRITIELYGLGRANGSPAYCQWERDTECADPEMQGKAVRDINGEDYSERRGEEVLKVKVRASESILGVAYTKDDKVVDRDVHHVCVLQESDTVSFAIWAIEDPPKRIDGKPAEPGDFVMVTGAKCKEYKGRVQFDAKGVRCAPAPMETQAAMVRERDVQIPRNAFNIFRILEPPLDDADFSVPWDSPDRRRLDPELVAAKRFRGLVCSWTTQFEGERYAGRFEDETFKHRNVIVNNTTFDMMDEGWVKTYEAKDGKEARTVLKCDFVQQAVVTRPAKLTGGGSATSSTQTKTQIDEVLFDVRIDDHGCRQILGVSDPTKWTALSKKNVPRMRMFFRAFIDHKLTYNAMMNDERKCDPEINKLKFSYKVVLRTLASTHVHSNLAYYLFSETVPITYECAKLALETNNNARTEMHAENYYNRQLPPNASPTDSSSTVKLFNLSEFNGAIEKFSTPGAFEFRLLDADLLQKGTRSKLAAMASDEERTRACSDALMGKEDSPLASEIDELSRKMYAVFALRRDLVDAIRAEPRKYSLEEDVETIEMTHWRYDPIKAAKEAAENSKKVMAEAAAAAKAKADAKAEAKAEAKKAAAASALAAAAGDKRKAKPADADDEAKRSAPASSFSDSVKEALGDA
jgi:hypothetical protein